MQIFGEFMRFLQFPVSADPQRALQISADFCRFPQIFADSRRSPQISAEIRKFCRSSEFQDFRYFRRYFPDISANIRGFLQVPRGVRENDCSLLLLACYNIGDVFNILARNVSMKCEIGKATKNTRYGLQKKNQNKEQ